MKSFPRKATSRFDFNTQTLHLSFPQAAMMMTARGTVDPSAGRRNTCAVAGLQL
ncbi:FimD/PapC N-terminal domain-containing protein [Escherichia coli]